MKLIQTFLFLFSLSSIPILCAQNETDLFRYSKNYLGGSARFEAMAGSFGALGADISSFQVNPAGYGRFSHSSVGFGIYGGSQSTRAIFNTKQAERSQGQVAPSTLGLVITNDVSDKGNGFLFNQFSFGYQQIDQFSRTLSYSGQQFSSLLDGFVDAAQGLNEEELNWYLPFSSDLAYKTHLMSFDPIQGAYVSELNAGDLIHNRTVNYSGGTGELYGAFSTNYLNKLYIGIKGGLRINRYNEEFMHTEQLVDTSNTDLRSFDYTYFLNTRGTGGNFSIGAVYLVSERLRTGLAVHSPTFYELKDNWGSNMKGYFVDSTSQLNEIEQPTGEYKYKLRTPTKITASLAYIFGTKGCVNVDVDYIDYRHAHFRSTSDINYASYSYESENLFAKEVFRNTVNIRIGGEYLVNNHFIVRVGLARYGKAFTNEQEAELTADWITSCGFGIRIRNASIDMSYRRLIQTRNYYAFSGSTTETNDQNHRITLSLNFLF